MRSALLAINFLIFSSFSAHTNRENLFRLLVKLQNEKIKQQFAEIHVSRINRCEVEGGETSGRVFQDFN